MVISGLDNCDWAWTSIADATAGADKGSRLKRDVNCLWPLRR
jgi:hypothetical protein